MMTQGRYPEFEKELIQRRHAHLLQQAVDERAIKAMGGERFGPRRLWQLVKRAGRPMLGWLSGLGRRKARPAAEGEERQEPRFGG